MVDASQKLGWNHKIFRPGRGFQGTSGETEAPEDVAPRVEYVSGGRARDFSGVMVP